MYSHKTECDDSLLQVRSHEFYDIFMISSRTYQVYPLGCESLGTSTKTLWKYLIIVVELLCFVTMETISMDNFPIQLDYRSEIEIELQYNTKP